MPRPQPAEPTIRLNIHLPASLRRRLDRHLHDYVLGGIPYGAYTEFFRRVVEEQVGPPGEGE